MSEVDAPTASSQTNVKPGSLVVAKKPTAASMYYRPLTHELLLVSKANQAAFENECRLMDWLVFEYSKAKDDRQQAFDDWFEAERRQSAPGRNTPQASQIVLQAKAMLDQMDEALQKKQQALVAAVEGIDTVDDAEKQLLELIPIPLQPSPKAPVMKKPDQDDDLHSWKKKWTYVRMKKVKGLFEATSLG